MRPRASSKISRRNPKPACHQLRRPAGRSPLFQPFVQQRVVCLQHYHEVKPALREEVAAVVVHHHAAFSHQVLQRVAHLRSSDSTLHLWGVRESQPRVVSDRAWALPSVLSGAPDTCGTGSPAVSSQHSWRTLPLTCTCVLSPFFAAAESHQSLVYATLRTGDRLTTTCEQGAVQRLCY